MTGPMEVFGGVLMRARVAAADVAARHTHPQMRPRGLTELCTPLAFASRQRLRFDDLGGKVLARFGDRRGARVAPA